MLENGKIRILVVDDSAVARGMWKRILEAEGDLEVVGTAENGISALDFLMHRDADLVLLDIEMPGMDGITALPLIQKLRPEVKIIIASALSTQGSRTAISALTLGASDFIAKPSATLASLGLQAVSAELIQKIRALKREQSTQGSLGNRAPPLAASAPIRRRSPGPGEAVPRAIVIGTSTGGPNALVTLLKGLPRLVTQPILIVQHMPPYFITALAERIAKETSRSCAEGRSGELIRQECVYLAPGDHHMTVEQGPEGPRLALDQGPHENFCRPAVDPLFRSAAQVLGRNLLAIVLTGMGEDGRRGAEAVVAQGGKVVAQDEATSVVWGMPGAVANAGLADAVLPLPKIAEHVAGICRGVARWGS